MSTRTANPDRLYDLLPAIHRMRDAERGQPLRALLQVIAEQVNAVEGDIAQLYDNWFIETCQCWVVPYIGDLVGYQPVHEAGEPGDPATTEGDARNAILIPRREVANLVRARRRKGTLALLEELARDAAGWPARAVEFYKLLGWTQPINHTQMDRGRLVNLRDKDALTQIDGPFDRAAHTIDVRRINSAGTTGRTNIPAVGLFVWRLKPYTVTATPACCLEESGPQCYEFSVVCHDTPLFTRPAPEADPTHIAGVLNVPGPIGRWAFDAHKEDYYGAGKSLQIVVPEWGRYKTSALPVDAIVPADLSDWSYRPERDHVAVDVVRGRIAFPPNQLPKKGVRVSYVYGFSADIGGGEYDRPIIEPAADAQAKRYVVGESQPFKRIGEALNQWRMDRPQAAVIELCDSGVYAEPISIDLSRDQSLQIRAANRARPIIRLLDWQTDLPDALSVRMSQGSRITFDGLLITGRSVNIRSAEGDDKPIDPCPAQVNIRHCTLVPGWGLDCDCEPKRPAEPSLELFNIRARVTIGHSILGSIQVNEDEVRTDPIPIRIHDSIVDATSDAREAIGAPGHPVAHVVLTLQRCTVYGEVLVHAIALAENCIFTNCVSVARRQQGCMRFCYVPEGCRTPLRFHCQPDLVKQAAVTNTAKARESERVRPVFNSTRYGRPAYAQLSDRCAIEIRHGADDESEMGVYHNLFNPQREANLRTRLDDYSPAGMQAGIIFVN